MRTGIALELGRVSNLPTVWTNTLAGSLLAGASELSLEFVLALVAFSLFYTGGMFLNDAFDAGFDAKVRPERPVPSGRASLREVFWSGFALLGSGVVLLAWIGIGFTPGTGFAPALAGLALAGAITLYDWHHKGNPLGPLIMGLCRTLVYVGAALCHTLTPPGALWLGAAAALCYLIGLTYVAKQENISQIPHMWPLLFLAVPIVYGAWLAIRVPVTTPFWLLLCGLICMSLRLLHRRGKGDIRDAVLSLISGIALLDAMLIAATGNFWLAVIALLAFGLTLFLQRYVPGT